MSFGEIPDSIFNKLVCSQCSCLLSVAPIGIAKDLKNVCGRCWSPSLIRNKPFEELATLHSFPCRYKSQGCTEYLQFNQAAEHENKCMFRSYKCPVNLYSKCNWQGFASHICQHYIKDHAELYLACPRHRIYFIEDYERYYLTKLDEMVFLLQTKFCSENKRIWLNAVCIEGANDNSLLSYKIKLTDRDGKRTMEFEDRKPISSIFRMEMITSECIEIDSVGLLTILQHPSSAYCTWSITFQKQRLTYSPTSYKYNSSKCPNCSIAMVPPIYRCPLSHLTCSDCKGYDGKCGICNKRNLEFTRAIDLENVSLTSQFVCRWRSCLKVFNCYQIRKHEQECNVRNYKCPECEQTVGYFPQIYNHFKTRHPQASLEIIQDECKLPIKVNSVYVLAHKEIFKVTVILDTISAWTVNVVYFGFPSLESYFRYEIKDCSNSLYYASKCLNNRYKATRSINCAKILSEHFLIVKFCKQEKLDNWIPFDYSPRRVHVA